LASDKLGNIQEGFMNAHDEIIEWLEDAYAMERSMELSLEKMSKNGSLSSECRIAASIHLTETKQHALMVESLLRSLGADTSSFKTGLGIMTETMKDFGAILSHDQQIKELLTCYSMEHLEIVCYQILASAAAIAGLPQVALACRQIMIDEEKMAETIRKILPEAVREHLSAAEMARAA
jgi:ferritin-like metal-binding protein YciE